MSGVTPDRLQKIAQAQAALTRAGITFDPRQNGAHLLVEHNGLRVEFAPGTGNWWLTEHNAYRGRGCRELIRFLTERPSPDTCGRWWYEGDAQQLPGLYTVGLWGPELYALNGFGADWDTIPIPTRVSAMPARWARAMNPLTGEVL